MAYNWINNLTGKALAENNDVAQSLAAFDVTDDGSGSGVTYSLSGGDSAYFNIAPDGSGGLFAKSIFNFEDSTHANGLYSVIVNATATDDGAVISQLYVLTITDVNEATQWDRTGQYNFPYSTIDENNDAGQSLVTFRAIDEDTAGLDIGISYSLSGDDAVYFSIDNIGDDRVHLYVSSSLNFEEKEFYSIIVTADSLDDSASISITYILSLNDVADTDWTASSTGYTIAEQFVTTSGHIAVASFKAAFDGDADAPISYFLSDSYEGGHFTIDDQGVLSVTEKDLNFESRDHYTVLVQAQAEEGGAGTEQLFVLTITDVNEPTDWDRTGQYNLPYSVVAENNPTGHHLTDFRAIDDDTADLDIGISYSLSGDDAVYFSIDNISDGRGRLYLKSSLNFEEDSDRDVVDVEPNANVGAKIYYIVVTANSLDDSAPITIPYVVLLNDADEGAVWEDNPTGNADVVYEGLPVGISLADFRAADPDGDGTAYYGLGANYGFDGGDQDEYFNIDLLTGELTTKSVLDFEEFTHYSVLVLSQASDGNKDVASELYILTVTDQIIEWGSDVDPLTGLEIAENDATPKVIANFWATDTGDASNLTYSLDGPDSSYFAIDPLTGELSTKGGFDFEDSGHSDGLYSVLVNATDTSSTDLPPILSTMYVLTITNVDEQVEWETIPTGNTISESLSIGTSVADFDAIDPEAGSAYYGLGSDYGFDGGHQDSYFNLDLYTGELTIKSALDFESQDHYTILALSQAGDGNKGVASELYILTVTDQIIEWRSDIDPLTGVEIVENDATPKVIANFWATDTGDASNLTYSLEDGPDNSYFSIDPLTGELSTTGAFDFEDSGRSDGLYSVLVNATDTSSSNLPPILSTMYVLTITNVDEQVEWETIPTGNTISESLSIGTSVADFDAIDPEAGSAYYGLGSDYGFDGGHQDSYFNLDLYTGELTIKSALDFETQDHYTILALSQAGDGNKGVASELYILTVTDQIIEWRSDIDPLTGVEIVENDATPKVIANFWATDTGDASNLTYSLDVDGPDNSYFSIDPLTGELSTKGSFDFEDSGHSDGLYSVLVNATDTSSTDLPPILSTMYVLTITNVDEQVEWETIPTGNTISESLAIGTSVADFDAVDPEAGSAYYGLGSDYGFDGGHQDSYFSIDLLTGELTIKSALDFESQDHYTILALSQAGSGNKGVASELYILTVTDQIIEWGSDIDPLTGLEIAENDTTPKVIANFWATDTGDASNLTYSLDGADSSYFSIDTLTGELSTKGGFDFEDSGHSDGLYTVLVNASDTSSSNLPPILSTMYVLTITNVDEQAEWETILTGNTISESLAIGTSVADFDAIDPEAENAYYGLGSDYGFDGGHQDSYFSIDLLTGELTIKSTLDFETQDHYTILALSQAGGGNKGVASQLYILTLSDVNLSPEWSVTPTTGGTLTENNVESHGLAIFYATDGEGTNVTYSLSGTDAAYFTIAPFNDIDGLYAKFTNTPFNGGGRLYAKSSFDFEDSGHTDGLYSVIITATATDDSPTAISTIYVLTITDGNDNATVWGDNPDQTGTTISENLAIGTSLADFNAIDGDSGITISYSVAADLGDGRYFAIDSTTGILTTTSSFDFENPATDNATNRYSVLVYAKSDDASPIITQVFVLTIGDANEAPEWSVAPATGTTFAENNDVGFGPIPFNATDDGGGTVTYSLSGTDAAYFSIDADNGGLYAASSFDFEDSGHTDGLYTITVNATATDDSPAALSHTFILTITNADEPTTWQTNGNPVGNTISENLAIGTSLADFNAIDGDGAGISYSVASDLGDGSYFAIDSTNGVLTAKSIFNFENPDKTDGLYSVLVYANSDDASDAISQVFVLTIADAAEPIVWVQRPISVNLAENNTAGGLITTVSAVDGDGSDISYVLVNANTDFNYFSINSETGEIYAKSSFDFENSMDYNNNNSYDVYIQARSADGDILTGSVEVIITNENESTAWQNNGNPVGNTISENLAIGTSLADFGATDGDGVAVTYSLSGDDTAYFNINATTGVLSAKSAFDFEDTNHTDGLYSVVVNANSTDASDAISQHFVLTIADVDDQTVWVDTGNSLTLEKSKTIAENNTVGGLIATFSARDEDIGATITYSFANDLPRDSKYFSLNHETGQLYAKSSFDFEDPNHDNSYEVFIQVHPSDVTTLLNGRFYLTITNDTSDDGSGGFLPLDPTPDQPVGLNGKILFDGTTDNIGGINDGVDVDGLAITGNDLSVTQYDSASATNTDLIITNAANFEQSFVGYTDADGNTQNHWFFVRDDAGDNTGHIVFDADGLDVNLESLSSGGATTTDDQINLLAGLNFGNDGDFAKPDDLDLNLNNNSASALTHDQFLALIGGSGNIDFV